jgi:hypothetical protein
MPIPSMPILSHCSKNLTRNFAERQSNHLEKWDSITWSISSLMVDLTAVPADSTIAASGACTDPRGWRWRPHHRHSCVDTGRHAHFAAGGGGARWDAAAGLAERDRPLHRLGEIERSDPATVHMDCRRRRRRICIDTARCSGRCCCTMHTSWAAHWAALTASQCRPHYQEQQQQQA